MHCTGMAAVGICPDCPITLRSIEKGSGYVAVQFAEFTVYSCYFSPNADFEDFKRYLDALDVSLSNRIGQKIIVAGNFNAKSEEWRCGQTDP